MTIHQFEIVGPALFESQIYEDVRGNFREWFKSGTVSNFQPVQGNMSISKKSVIRGVHFNLSEEGQAKYVTCIQGAIFDVFVDLRPNSKTFMQNFGVELTGESNLGLYIPRGFGHAFQALSDDSVVTYLLDSEYSPANEFGIHPHDVNLNIAWPLPNAILSEKDRGAPSVEEFVKEHQLMDYFK